MFIKHKKILAGASIIALIACGSALAEKTRTANQNDVPRYNSQDVKQGLKEAKDVVSDAAESVSTTTQETYEDIKGALNGQAGISPIKVDQRMTATGMIGQPVYNISGERVAKVKDIILNKEGDAIMVVLADGDWTGLGKLAAFDYNVITQTSADGRVIAPLTENMIDTAAPFSYDPNTNSESVMVVPQNGYSVAELLNSELINPEGDTVANIENISFRNGVADRLVVSFGKIMGLGGNTVAMSFTDPDIVNKDGKPHFKLSETQARQFEAYKSAALN